MTTSSWPYSTASPGSTRLAPTTPSAGATTSCGTPSMSTTPSRSPAGPVVPARASGRGWKIADRRRGGDAPVAGVGTGSRRSVAPSRPSRPGPTGGQAGDGRVRWPWPPAPATGCAPAARRSRRDAGPPSGRRSRTRQPALADLELAEPGRRRAWRSGPAAARRPGGRWRRGPRPLGGRALRRRGGRRA